MKVHELPNGDIIYPSLAFRYKAMLIMIKIREEIELDTREALREVEA